MLAPLLVLPLIFGPLDGLSSDPIDTQIYGGSEVESCGWPSAVYLQTVGGGACTGTLIHPLIVLTAAHCINDASITNVRFGESAQTAMKLADTEYCKQNPGWFGATAQGQDYGYCKLKAPITNVPIVPVAAGCEASAIRAGARIMHVGFGQDQDGNSGQKKMLDTTINQVTGVGEILSGNFSEIICNGDSGGPAFVWLDPAVGGDGTWRVAAIHSWAQGADPVDPNCNGQAGSVLVSQAIEFIENDSGVDITPCTDGNDWAPTAHCGGYPFEPWETQGGSYPMGCQPTDVLEFSGVCGPALDETPDATPPSVQILSPTNEEEYTPDGGSATVSVEVIANDEGGWGIETVALTVRSITLGMEQVEERNEFQPWEFSATLPAGAYEVEAIATDYAGNVSDPVTVCFGVGEPGCADEDDSDTDTDAGTDTDDSDTDDEVEDDEESGEDGTTGEPEATDGGGAEGCGCRTTTPAGLPLLGLLLLGLRRRGAAMRRR